MEHIARKWLKNVILGPYFLFFSHFSAHLLGEAITHFSATSPDFGPKARKQSVAGQRDHKGSVLLSSRQSDLRIFNKLHLHPGNFFNYFSGELI